MKTDRLTSSESLLLDIIRTAASIMVAFGHLTQRFFSTGWPNLTPVAIFSVTIFFVLSGFVIRYVTCRKPTTFGQYLGDRASRIYSVALPALALTLLIHFILIRHSPSFYDTWKITHPFRSILVNLVFCGELWNHLIRPLSDGPFWSVNYEVAYYLLYGCFFYVASRSKWILLAAVTLFFGPRILYLAPLWIAGCLAHDLYQRWTAQGVILRRLSILSAALAVISALYLWLGHTHPHAIAARTPAFLTILSHYSMVPGNIYLLGIVWIVVFLWLLLLARRISVRPDSAAARAIRFIAEGTFPIYLIHYPIYVLVAVCIPYNHAAPLPKLAMFVTVIVLGVLAGHPANIFKNKLRGLALPSLFRLKPSAAATRSQS